MDAPSANDPDQKPSPCFNRLPVVLLIDNYDSFVHNLARYFEQLGQTTRVVRNDAITADEALALRPDAIVLSPGPCTPQQAGCSIEIVRRGWCDVPMLGVCLGHQAIAAALGGRVVRAAEPMHGRTSRIAHDGAGVFRGVRNPLTVCRYHSLIVERASLPDCLEISAQTDDGTIMAVRHRELPLVGVQFHPESILTEDGYAMLANFLRLCRLPVPDSLPVLEAQHLERARRPEAGHADAVQMASDPHEPNASAEPLIVTF
jgi:anthranilate synthase/aminodeoxychorismate synthase-like glutamine amidotransferase